MTDAELALIDELVAALRAGQPIDGVAVGLDPALVEVAALVTGELAEAGALAGQVVPAGFGAIWSGVGALGGVGASGGAGGAAGAVGGGGVAGGGGTGAGGAGAGGAGAGGAGAGGAGAGGAGAGTGATGVSAATGATGVSGATGAAGVAGIGGAAGAASGATGVLATVAGLLGSVTSAGAAMIGAGVVVAAVATGAVIGLTGGADDVGSDPRAQSAAERPADDGRVDAGSNEPRDQRLDTEPGGGPREPTPAPLGEDDGVDVDEPVTGPRGDPAPDVPVAPPLAPTVPAEPGPAPTPSDPPSASPPTTDDGTSDAPSPSEPAPTPTPSDPPTDDLPAPDPIVPSPDLPVGPPTPPVGPPGPIGPPAPPVGPPAPPNDAPLLPAEPPDDTPSDPDGEDADDDADADDTDADDADTDTDADADPAPTRVNFQAPGASPPAGYLIDVGHAFGARTAREGDDELRFGWRDQRSGEPIDLGAGGTTSGNGRTRDIQADARLDTLIHLQSVDLVRTGTAFDGSPVYAYWELELPSGTYEVTVAAGDAAMWTDPERHTVNVEGRAFIEDFVPSGPAGAATRHATSTAVVEVTDGALTIDAVGGRNAKLHYVDVVATDAEADALPLARQVAFATEALTGQGNVIGLVDGADVATARLVDDSPGAIASAGAGQIRVTFEVPPSTPTWLVVHYATTTGVPRELRLWLTVDAQSTDPALEEEPTDPSAEEEDDGTDAPAESADD